MKNKKQTAVEWLVKQMFKQGYFDGNKPLSITSLDHLEYEAKEMEKEQIINGRITAPITTGDIELDRQEAEHYYTQEYGQSFYNETYGS